MSEGAEIKFKISQSKLSIDIFTTRPETIFGASFIALSVEHPLSSKFLDDEKFEIKRKLIMAKREVKNFTRFRYFLDLKKILNT